MIVKLAFAFGAGFISFLTPCVLPIIPGYISYITGKNLNEIEQDKKNVLLKTILFSLGFSIVFIFLGATASAVGNILLFLSNELRIAAGILIILFSLHMIGVLNFKFLNQEKRYQTKSYSDNYAFPFLVGAAFFGWTPCIGRFRIYFSIVSDRSFNQYGCIALFLLFRISNTFHFIRLL